MKLAIAGKGGSGKTSISGTMARVLARDGHDVLAIDADSNPNLALTLGIPADGIDDVPTLPSDLIHRGDDGITLTKELDEVRRTHSLEGPDGVTLLVMANPRHAGTGCLCGMHATVRTLIGAASDAEGHVCILDTEASPEHLSRGTAKYADTLLCIVEPWFKSLETARRMASLGKDLGLTDIRLIANKIRDDRELDAVRQFTAQHELELAGVVPFDDQMLDAERAKAAPLDFAPESPAVTAISRIAKEIAADGRA